MRNFCNFKLFNTKKSKLKKTKTLKKNIQGGKNFKTMKFRSKAKLQK